MLVPATLIVYVVGLGTNYVFGIKETPTLSKLVSDAMNLTLLVGFLSLYKKERKAQYTQEDLVSGIYLTFNAVFFLFLLICLIFVIYGTINFIQGTELITKDNLFFMIYIIVFTTIFIIINLTKNIKLLQ